MFRLLVGLAPAIVVLVHAMAPPSAEAHIWGRCGGYYSPRYYSYGYGGYRSSCYNYGNYGCSSYGYSGYAPYGMAGGYGFGGGSALTTLLAAGGLGGGSNASMYLTVPMSNGYGPASLLQVPVGGAAGRPTYLQVPVGGMPGQPVYLQMELGSNPATQSPYREPGPTSPMQPPQPMRPSAYDRLTVDDLHGADAIPFAVTAEPSITSFASTSTATSEEPTQVERPSASGSPFRFAVLERSAAPDSVTVGTPAKTAARETTGTASSPTAQSIEQGPSTGLTIERPQAGNAAPWEVR